MSDIMRRTFIFCNMQCHVMLCFDMSSYGMLCSESELKLSEESEGIIALSHKFTKHIGKSYFKTKNNNNVIELSITPNRPDCLGIRGIARDLYASGYVNLK